MPHVTLATVAQLANVLNKSVMERTMATAILPAQCRRMTGGLSPQKPSCYFQEQRSAVSMILALALLRGVVRQAA